MCDWARSCVCGPVHALECGTGRGGPTPADSCHACTSSTLTWNCSLNLPLPHTHTYTHKLHQKAFYLSDISTHSTEREEQRVCRGSPPDYPHTHAHGQDAQLAASSHPVGDLAYCTAEAGKQNKCKTERRARQRKELTRLGRDRLGYSTAGTF